jgi:hypothetical protein
VRTNARESGHSFCARFAREQRTTELRIESYEVKRVRDWEAEARIAG